MLCNGSADLLLLVFILQPHYEKVARLFNGANAVHPGLILMSRVDCAEKVLLLFYIDVPSLKTAIVAIFFTLLALYTLFILSQSFYLGEFKKLELHSLK